MFLFKSKSAKKRRSEYVDAVKIFIQVHYVRERSSERYKYNTLTIKTDPDRDECQEWYNEHNNPDKFADIVRIYMNEKAITAETLTSKYNLDSSVFSDADIAKGDAVAICLGLKLNFAQTKALLKTAGHALTNSSEADLLLRYCIENGITDIDDINYLLTTVCETTLKEIV